MFITFEGTDGSGKSTVIKNLCRFLDKNNVAYVLTKEPGSPVVKRNKEIRNFVLSSTNEISPMVEALLYATDRRIHLEEVIWPALKAKKVVLCDRYIDSSLAYQGHARALGIKSIWKINKIISENTLPDISFFLDLNYKEAKRRMAGRKAPEKDRIERENDKFKAKIYKGYKKVIKMFPERFVVINANQSRETVYKQVREQIAKLLKI